MVALVPKQTSSYNIPASASISRTSISRYGEDQEGSLGSSEAASETYLGPVTIPHDSRQPLQLPSTNQGCLCVCFASSRVQSFPEHP